eukprot:TRINITY_DN7207_c0_g1_i3.p2 TRINITY_DN7207_c0_g1~~TRINITY_DN7207_c0_g1_i3.p2  ORF type:complete len:103 (-),score=17.31 TRINITY_DN7207_c0_g1_i3:262-570(-)
MLPLMLETRDALDVDLMRRINIVDWLDPTETTSMKTLWFGHIPFVVMLVYSVCVFPLCFADESDGHMATELVDVKTAVDAGWILSNAFLIFCNRMGRKSDKG